MYRENSEALSGNDRFEGYNVDLISEVASILGFNYTIKIVADGNYGSYNEKNKTWNGMIGELLSQKADLAVADLTITYERETGVDFTMPFMNLGEFVHFCHSNQCFYSNSQCLKITQNVAFVFFNFGFFRQFLSY